LDGQDGLAREGLEAIHPTSWMRRPMTSSGFGAAHSRVRMRGIREHRASPERGNEFPEQIQAFAGEISRVEGYSP